MKPLGSQRALMPLSWLLLFCAFSSNTSQAAIVTVTIAGTVSSGIDFTGVFGFPPNSELMNQPFAISYTFDDSKGLQKTNLNCTYEIVNTLSSNPGTASVSIAGSPAFIFGTFANASPASQASLNGGDCGSGGATQDVLLSFTVSDLGLNRNQLDSLDTSVTVIGAEFAKDTSWEFAFPSTSVPGGGIRLAIDRVLPNGTLQQAGAQLFASTISVAVNQAPLLAPLQFIPVTPCRIADTRNTAGPFGGPELAARETRSFTIPQSACQIPNDATAYSLNVTAVPDAALGYLSIWPSGQSQPVVSTLNSDGRVKANAAIVPAGTGGGVSVYVTDSSHVILDINGYFAPKGTASALAFYPVTPCRVADTRNAAGPLGGPAIGAGTSRSFPVQTSNCNLPASAMAYAFNVTSVPHGPLDFLTMWPSGQPQPLVSTLNATTGVVTANAAIVPAGSNGDVSVFVYDTADVVLDVNGYFAAPSDTSLSLYTVEPCRVLDTRTTSGAFNGALIVPVDSTACASIPTAQAYVMNATVVPPTPLSYLTLWAHGENQPLVSTLNAADGSVTSNMAIVPTNDGEVEAFSTSSTQLVLDLSAYFAP